MKYENENISYIALNYNSMIIIDYYIWFTKFMFVDHLTTILRRSICYII